MAGFLGDLFNSITGQQSAPQQTIVSTQDLFKNSYNTANALAPQFQSLNATYQPLVTGTQLANENQIYGPAANGVRQGVYQSILDNLNLGNSVPQQLQDLITTNTLQGLGSSGIGAADAGKLFGSRSLLSAGLDLASQRRNEALQATHLLPTSSFQYQPIGLPNVNNIAAMQDQEQAARDRYANIQEQVRRSNFSSLINTGGRILGAVIGGVATGGAGTAMGAQIGGSVLGSGGGVYGYGQQQGGGGQGDGFTSLLSGLFGGGGGFGGGAGQQYANANGGVSTSIKALPITNV